MGKIKNRIDLCFNLLDLYEENVKNSILRNNISEKETSYIMKNFKFKNEILFSLNKEYKKGSLLKEFCKDNNLSLQIPDMLNFHHSLYKHQEDAVKSILKEKCTIVSTGTGSGKTESFLIPILDYCIKNKDKKGVKAVIIYPMNALASDQLRRIEEAAAQSGITYAIFNGETPKKKDNQIINDSNSMYYREDIVENKPDILITNYVMLERIITNDEYLPIFESPHNIFKYVVLDEIHTYNGNKALHIKFLLDRLRYYVNTKVVQIGCSATLSRNKNNEKTDGYISGDINDFIINMFSLKTKDEYEYIEPIYEDINSSNYKNINDDDYNKFKEDTITKIIKNYLYDGCKSFNEILKTLNDHNINILEEDLKCYFSNILRLNENYNNYPILDFRIHLFILDIGKYLRRCINCGRYYTHCIGKCNDCGHVILPVYKENPKLLLGNLKNGQINDPTKLKETEKKNLVLIDLDNCKDNNFKYKLSFNSYELKDDSIRLIIDKEGKYKVYWDSSISYSLIELKKNSNETFLYKLLKKNFSMLNEKEKKILAFIDNREKCGRYSTVLGDELLSEFYFEIIKFCNTKEGMSINNLREKTLYSLNEYLENNNEINENIKEIVINDFDVWFRRILINKKFRQEHDCLNLEVKKIDDFKEIDDFIINISLDEGIFFEDNLKKMGKVIRVSRSSFEFSKGIGFKTFPNKNVVSLSEHGTKYKEIIRKYTQNELKESIKKLVSYKILKETIEKKDTLEWEKTTSIFYLDKNNCFIKTNKSNYHTLREVFEEHLLLTGAHSSEVEKDVKKSHEDDFQNGDINLLVATPTLEMGIDIGSLSFVYMLGVPPVPSNYAQRAGRAGRRGNRFACIITLCSEKSNHDWYYFYNPKEIIEGLITPPRFDINNEKVLNKHISTIVYPRLADRNFSYISNDEKDELQSKCKKIFRKSVDIDYNIQFIKQKVKSLRKFNIKSLYNNAIYPEYCFNRHDVILVKENNEIDGNTKKVKEVEIATREPELAYKQIVPGTIMFVGEKYYYINLFEDNKTFISMNKEKVLSSWKYKCEDNEKNIKKFKEIIPKSSYVLINLNCEDNIVKEKGPVKIYHNKNMNIELISEIRNGNIDLFVGYQLIRDTIVFEFDTLVLSKEQYISLIALLDKTIKYELGLDENEISLIIDDEILINNVSETAIKDKAYVLIYDKTGNENIDMRYILNRICRSIDGEPNEMLLKKAYMRVSNCKCEKQSGCYLCIKSFNTHRYSENINKNSARNFVGYLIGKEKLIPHVSIREEILKHELEINVKQVGNNFKLTLDNKEKILKNKARQNETILNGIIEELIQIYENDDIETILITSPLDYLVKGINEKENLNVTDDSLGLFMFYKQAFKSIIAEKVVK